ncbi:MAG: DUF1566 domain-containing protein [Planctomycetes bacterium]|nr:DUF1566 domain-containing protein [Planctomycetota bacterium]
MIGADGPIGPIGQTGAASTVAGPTGQQGFAGPTGGAGLQGGIGQTGGPGATGVQGFQGQLGFPGSPGIPGAPGIDGVRGPQGERGIIGATGPAGLQGIAGITGPQGPNGSNGQPGLPGLPGATSIVAGPTGPTGPTGTIAGPQGQQGLNGTGNIGRYYEGGWIAAEWKEGTDTRFLILAQPDITAIFPWTIPPFQTQLLGAANYWNGPVDTADIVAQSGAGSYAAKYAADLVLGGYSDWYLPSIWELNMVYNSAAQISKAMVNAGFPAIINQIYWSSTENIATNNDAYVLNFGSLGAYEIFSEPKANFNRCLAVRLGSLTQ